MTIPAITFSVQVGGDGFTIARQVAEKLGYNYCDWKITAQTRNLAGPDLDDLGPAGLAERIMSEVLAAATFEQEIPAAMLMASPDMLQQTYRIVTLERHREHVEQIVWDLALRGRAVIVGHGSQAILMGQPHVLSVLVVSPFKLRAEQLALAQGSPLSQVEATLRELDELKRSYLHRTYRIDWLDASNYDLVINSGEMPVEAAVSLITAAAASNKVPGLMTDDPSLRSLEWAKPPTNEPRLHLLPDAA